ncbi:MAG: MBL fold metallo-hydrolase [Candidatus Thiodiazotropha sp.]
MGSTSLFNHDGHAFILLDGFGQGEMVPTNQVVIQDGNEAILLDPGGHKVHYEVINEVSSLIPISDLKYLFFSHQDPDIIAAANAWLMLTEADALISKLWVRFIPHFGIDELLLPRLQAIPDEGMRLKLGNSELILLPAHFLHSAGNFQVYDPKSKILFSGDLGASIGPDYLEVTDFDDHIQYMESFHLRYMPSNQANRCWAEMVRNLEIEKIVPQHGAIFPDAETSRRFIDWIDNLPGAVEILKNNYTIPGGEPDAQKSEPENVEQQSVSDSRVESAKQTHAVAEDESVVQDQLVGSDLTPDVPIDSSDNKKSLSWSQRLKSVFKGGFRD